jgi:hypothetical protein
LHRLHELARERQLQLVSVVPHVQSVWNCFLRNTALPATLLTLEDDGLTVMVAGLRQLELVTTFVHQRQAGLIERELQRLRLGAANQALGNIHLGGPVSLHAMAAGVPLALALRPRYLTRERYRDFRELGFCEVEST